MADLARWRRGFLAAAGVLALIALPVATHAADPKTPLSAAGMVEVDAGGTGSGKRPITPRTSVAPGPVWPATRDGIVFVWEASDRPNEVVVPGATQPQPCRVEAHGHARFGRYHVMDLVRGSMTVDGFDQPLLAACRKSNQLTLEAILTPAAADQTGPAAITAFGLGPDACNFLLGQQGDRLVLRLKTSAADASAAAAQADLGKLVAGQPQHVMVTYQPGRLRCYRDGVETPVSGAVAGNLASWLAGHLVFGNEPSGVRPWSGELDGVAIYSRALTPDEAKEQAARAKARLAERRPAPRLVIDARLSEATPTPDLRTLGLYRRALVVNAYKVEKVVGGRYEGKDILVAQWAILDGKVLPVSWRVGQVCRLTLESMDDHPQLESERLVMGFGRPGLPMYYEVGR